MATALASSSSTILLFPLLLRNPNPKPNPPRPQFLLLPPVPIQPQPYAPPPPAPPPPPPTSASAMARSTPWRPLRPTSSASATDAAITTARSPPWRPLLPPRLRQPAAYFKPPIVAAVAAMARWLRLFSEALLVRLLLTWFPNVPWDRQPFSALRDLCDPYLSIFRKVLPPLGNVDFSPILALTVLGVISSILQRSPPMQ
uniref:YlmG homolog protein 1-2, chloroplastic-like n=1 Tax=Ananas comosus var. bracteatus TaxID=296719 RepID=A0A6V7NMK3_ANACO|nr:unnamed protein product [Ananas comosus var. bracteatus]